MRIVAFVLALFVSVASGRSPAPVPEHSPWDVQALSKAPPFEWTKREGKVHSLSYEAEPYKGVKTKVFALYGTPATVGVEDQPPGRKWPAVVLVHGGGGHAFSGWVEHYAKRGYCAIAMDLAGNTGETGKANRHENSGPPQDDGTKFRMSELPDKDQWTYHAVADVILAHSLIRSFPEVDAERTGVSGISWGGYLTCIVAGVDHRFKAAAPVYGCGFLHENSAWKPTFARMTPQEQRQWVKMWDPSQYVGSAPMSMFFVNGTNDQFYPLDSYAKTYALVQSEKNIRIQPKMPHGHIFDIKECFLFFDEKLKGSAPLPVVGEVKVEGDEIAAEVKAKTKLLSAQLHFTSGPHTSNKDRNWTTVELTVDGGKVRGNKPPADSTAWFITLSDERGAMVSSAPVIADMR